MLINPNKVHFYNDITCAVISSYKVPFCNDTSAAFWPVSAYSVMIQFGLAVHIL